MNICIIIPVYNHASTIATVIEGALKHVPGVIIVDDGSTDSLAEALQPFLGKVTLISNVKNRGKGHALRCGFAAARAGGFDYALTLDADGQHRSEDIPVLLRAVTLHPDSLIIGSRNLEHENMPMSNTFANRFSNFWFAVQTWRLLPDTQTGFRVYPLKELKKLKFFTSRYEAELELLVRLAWRGTPLVPVGINVYYPPHDERITHFHPFRDFFRISVLNIVLTPLAIVYGYPRMVANKLIAKH